MGRVAAAAAAPMTNSKYLGQQLRLQTASLALERKKVAALNNIAKAVSLMADDLVIIKGVVCSAYNVEVMQCEQ